MVNKFYITTPIYYVNASPHIGHSYTNIAADTLARYYRQRKDFGKDNVWFLTGTDEHGQKIKKAADEAKLNSQEFVDKVVETFKDLWKTLEISNNDFIRTTEERHIKTVQRALEIVYNKGDIYEGKYEGWYCTPCETFWPQTQVVDNLCPDCKRPLGKISESNYFFKLSKYQQWLIDYIKDTANHPERINFIAPLTRRNEVLGFLENNKLEDLCISRPKERLSWGIPLPFSGKHVVYVWFDALINYISAVGEFDGNGVYHSKWWQPDVKVAHLVGKDILRHHAVYWPIMLEALGIRQPDTIFAHGWWMIDQNKMSKSRGNAVSPLDLVKQYGVDTYRYFLLRDVPFGLDGNFSEEAIVKRFNADLANDLGNLLYRTLTMIEKYYQGNIPDLELDKIKFNEAGEKIKKAISTLEQAAYGPIAINFDFSLSLGKIWELINLANKYVEETKPWNLAKENKTEELKSFIRLLVEALRVTARNIYPFMPLTSESIIQQIGEEKIKKGNPLFPRIETKEK
ncbi:MAG: methionine--tRNA ligase [Candidatus Omnitrophota bacterium]|nr:methionine--tRNA ligase [Candidatus Omnitrophota bacterium]